jgi:hypothetical protein
MKLLERRMRVSWGWFIVAVICASLAIFALRTDLIVLLPGRHTHGRVIAKLADPVNYAFVLALYCGATVLGLMFAFYQFRRGSWFNPI